jgi:hypothetical protein
VSHSDLEHIPPGAGVPLKRPLLTTSIVIYATYALLALTIPRSLVNWVKNFEPNKAQSVALDATEGLAAVSRSIGADRPFAFGRELFLRVTGKRDD